MRTLGELLRMDIPHRDYLISPWLKQGESALIYAAPGVGKSMLTLTLALTIAGGGKFLAWQSHKPRRVLFVDGEMNTADLQERVRLLQGSVRGIDLEAAGTNLTFIARQDQDPEATFPDLATPEGQRTVYRRARGKGADLLILDNFSTLFTCEDENAAAAFNEVVKFLMRLKQAGIACILVHHTNKSGDNYRGSSKLATTFEVIQGLKSVDPAAAPEGGIAFDVTWDKFRGKRFHEVTMPQTVRFGTGSDGGESTWSAEQSPKAKLAELVEAVQSMAFETQDALAAHFGVTKGAISKWKAQAIHKHGLITAKAWDDYMTQARGEAEVSDDF